MKYITDPQYSKILKLLQSPSKDDVLIGVELLDKSDFTDKELEQALPGLMTKDKRRDIPGNLKDTLFVPIREGLTIEVNSAWVSIYRKDW